MIGHLEDRAAALTARGWTRREAVWLAPVCRHSGVFLRSQHTITKVIATGDPATLEGYGDLNPALQRTCILNVARAESRRSTTMITTGRTWRSTQLPSDLLPAVDAGQAGRDYTRSAAPEV